MTASLFGLSRSNRAGVARVITRERFDVVL